MNELVSNEEKQLYDSITKAPSSMTSEKTKTKKKLKLFAMKNFELNFSSLS